jgi:hypothetical protein
MPIRQNTVQESQWRVIGMASVLAALMAIVVMIGEPRPADAAAAPCDSDAERPASRPAAQPAVAADLAEPFTYIPAQIDRPALLAEVVQVVRAQAAEGDADPCYLEKPARIAARVDFLSPFEFLVVTMFDQEPAKRDALLDQYVSDPRGAIKQLGEAFPSMRAQATLAAFAYYDVTSDRIRVNAAKVPPDQLRRVLVHEFWHAMPRARTWTEPDGRTLRASGFWLQEQRAGRRVWIPVEDRRGLPYSSYLLDEAMATLMETRYAGPSQFARSELEEVQRFLGRLMGVAGSGAVLRDYLESRPYELGALTEAHRSSFPELEIVARP